MVPESAEQLLVNGHQIKQDEHTPKIFDPVITMDNNVLDTSNLLGDQIPCEIKYKVREVGVTGVTGTNCPGRISDHLHN